MEVSPGSVRRRDQVQPAGLGRLDVGGAPSGGLCVHQQDPGRDVLAERTGHGDREQLAAQRRVQHLEEARAAVRQRAQLELVAGRVPAPAVRDRLGGLAGGEGPGEAVRGHEHAHPRSLAHPVGRSSARLPLSRHSWRHR